jgi:hypothetical protein
LDTSHKITLRRIPNPTTSPTASVRLSALHVQLARQEFNDDEADIATAPGNDRRYEVPQHVAEHAESPLPCGGELRRFPRPLGGGWPPTEKIANAAPAAKH